MCSRLIKSKFLGVGFGQQHYFFLLELLIDFNVQSGFRTTILENIYVSYFNILINLGNVIQDLGYTNTCVSSYFNPVNTLKIHTLIQAKKINIFFLEFDTYQSWQCLISMMIPYWKYFFLVKFGIKRGEIKTL